MKLRLEQNLEGDILDFYTDYYGNFLKTNGAAYEPKEVSCIRVCAQASFNKNIELYEIDLKNGKKGRLKIHSGSANYMGASRFVVKCKELLNLDI